MELKDFVGDTLIQICEGVRAASEKGLEIGAVISPHTGNIYGSARDEGNGLSYVSPECSILQYVEFDVAVTVVEATSSSAGGGLQICVIRAAGGMRSDETSTSVNRIQFKVPMALPALPHREEQ